MSDATAAAPPAQVPERISLTVRPGRLAGPALSRMVGIVASRAEMPVDLLEDALTIADLVARHMPGLLVSPESLIQARLSAHPGRLEVEVGPLEPGGGERLAAAADADGVIAMLASATLTLAAVGGERLLIELRDGREVSPFDVRGTTPAVESPRAVFAVVDIDDPSGVHVIAVRGEIDISSAAQVKLAARNAVVAGHRRIVLDLTDATFLDSTGLGAIIGLARLVRPDGDVAIVNIDANIARTFEITGLNEIFAVRRTRPEAIAALGEPRSPSR